GPVVGALSDTTLEYWDYQSRATWRVGTGGTLGAFAFGAHDRVGHIGNDGADVEDFASDFHRLDLRFDHAWNDGRLRVATALGYDRQGAEPTYLTNRSVQPRFEIEQDLGAGARLRGGLEGAVDLYRLREGEPPPDEAL